jgi:hypothetical protein
MTTCIRSFLAAKQAFVDLLIPGSQTVKPEDEAVPSVLLLEIFSRFIAFLRPSQIGSVVESQTSRFINDFFSNVFPTEGLRSPNKICGGAGGELFPTNLNRLEEDC